MPLVIGRAIGISPFLVMVSLLVDGTAGGLVGALIAVPIAAATEIVLSRLQARETPVVEDPSAIEASDEATAVAGEDATVVATAVAGDPGA